MTTATDARTVTLARLGDRRLWRDEIAWLADTLARRSLSDHADRLRWAHAILQPLDRPDGRTAVRVQVDIAGRDLVNLTVVDRNPQAALHAAFARIDERLQEYQPTA